MPRSNHIDGFLNRWPYDPDSVSVRVVKGRDGREVLQMRVDMGVLQLEMAGRPDGERPKGYETYCDYLVARIEADDDFILTEEECSEVDREFAQFYHRRICWFAVHDYEGAARDARHSLDLMDVCRRTSPDKQWTASHEQYRPFVLFHHAQATALAAIDEQGPEEAVEAANAGLEEMRQVFIEYDAEDHFDDDELVGRLIELRESLREQYDVGVTLQEQLASAIADEQYELAASIRDQLAARSNKKV